ncbi:MAG: hypothetical protein ACU0DI_05615 [Paracoccaceae bacterium]
MQTHITMAYHLGAPHTDNDQLTWSLRKDSRLLSDHGVMLRRPREYRNLISGMISKLDGQKASLEGQELLLATIVKQQKISRLIFSNSKYLGVPSWMFKNGIFYQNAGSNTAKLRNLFPDNPCEFFLSIRNPATFVPSSYTGQNSKNYREFVDNVDFQEIRWSDVIDCIQQENPDCPITVWCNEDTPIIWPTVLSKVTALNHQTQFSGGLDIVKSIISKEGAARLEKYLNDSPALSEQQRRTVTAIFLEKFVVDDAVEEEIDLPGWTEYLVEEMTQIYEYDIELLKHIPGVNFISA